MSITALFPDALHVGSELDWVYTSSRKVARVFELPHAEVMQRIVKLNSDLAALGDEWDWERFRFGVLSHGFEEAPGEGGTEWLLSRDSFLLLVMDFDGEMAAQVQRLMMDGFARMYREINNLKPQMKAAQS